MSDALFRGFVGGRGAGKTYVGALDVATRAGLEENSGRTYLVASPTGVKLQDETYPTFESVADRLGLWDPKGVRLSPYPTVRLRSGASVRFRTAEDPEKLRGPNLSGVWLDEASLMHHNAFKICIACLRERGRQGWLSATFTPKGFTHWTYEQFGKARPDTACFHATTAHNPFNPEQFAATLSAQYGTGLYAEQELGGRFVAVEGAEWPAEYFPESIWFDEWPDRPWVVRAMALDPSKGKDTKTPDINKQLPDFSAYVWGATDRDGHVWVDADLDQARDATKIVADGIGHFLAFRPGAVLVETNAFQSLLQLEFNHQCHARNLPALPLWGIVHTAQQDKTLRIRDVGHYLARRELHFRDTPGGRKLVAQLRDFPQGVYDDGPDALQMLLLMLLTLILGPRDGSGQPRLLRA